jgi:ketosteroid isomerase-like protein
MFVIGVVAPRVSAQADEVLKLQKQFQDAVVAADTSEIAPLMADEAIFIHGNGMARTEAQFLAAISAGQLALSAYDPKDPKVVLFDGGAIVSGSVDLTFKPRPNATTPPMTIHMRGSSVWVQRAGKWTLLLDQDTTISGPPLRHTDDSARADYYAAKVKTGKRTSGLFVAD